MIILLLLVLLFFGLSSCQKRELEIIKDEKITQTCVFPNENFNDFHRLLARADLCSEGWFKDLDSFINRIKDQNIRLAKRKGKEYKEILRYQKALLKELKNFKREQNVESIDALKKEFLKYKTYYEKKCEGKREN